jgi:hypothetical protein
MLVLSACQSDGNGDTPATNTTSSPTQPAGSQTDKVYRVINPSGNFIPVETKPLSPRLSTLDGMTIYFNESEANPRIMPALLKRLKEEFPNTTFHYTASASFGDRTPSDDLLENADAVIRGISW